MPLYFRITSSILFVFVLSRHAHSQVISSQNAGLIVELETAQSPTTGTFVSCSMKRIHHQLPEDEQILIHRSTNNTSTWDLMKIYTPVGDEHRLLDPVIAVDEEGTFYVVFMRIETYAIPIPDRLTHLDLYRSTDDGISWEFVGRSHSDILPDYPQLIAKGAGQLYLTFGNALNQINQSIYFISSSDGGDTWSEPNTFQYPKGDDTQVGIPDLNWGMDSTIHLSFGSRNYKGPCHVQSEDYGKTWSGFLFTDQDSSSATTSVLSKVISNPKISFYGILSHRPHHSSTPITYHYPVGHELRSTLIGSGAYAEGILTKDSIVHIIYNELDQDTFRLQYVVSASQGLSFTDPITLYQGKSQGQEFGEYQSLILGQDDQFYLTFCDWADSSRAKTLVFEQLRIEYTPVNIQPDPVLSSTISNQGYNVFPNPSTGLITIEFQSKNDKTEVLVYSGSGKLFKQVPLEIVGQKTLDLSGLPKGTYLIMLKEQRRIVVKRIKLI